MRSFLSAAFKLLPALLAALVFVPTVNAAKRSTAPPEALLAEDTALYFRFDGLKPHRAAYERTVFSQLMKDEFGPLADFIGRSFVAAYGPDVVEERFLAGLKPAQLLKLRRAAKKLPHLLSYLEEHGIVVGLEVARQPALRWQVTLVFPNGAEGKHRATLFGAFRLWASLEPFEVTEVKKGDRNILTFETVEIRDASCYRTHGVVLCGTEERETNEEPEKNVERVRSMCWQEGRHVIWTIGTAPFSDTLALIQGKRRNLTENAEFKRVAGFQKYETYARGFVHLNRILAFIKDDSAETDEFLDGLGLNGITTASAHLGFAGQDQRQTVVLKTTGPRTGLLGLVSAKSNTQLKGLPQLPPDAASVSVRTVKPGDFFVGAARVAELMLWFFDVEPLEFREAMQDFVKSFGAEAQREFLESLDSKVVISNTPSEGPFFWGTTVMIRVKDERRLEKTLPVIAKSIAELFGSEFHVRRRRYRGTDLFMLEIEELQDSEIPIIPTCAIHNGWFVIGFLPQTVQGFIVRSSGKYNTWEPARLLSRQFQAAKLPVDSGDHRESGHIAAFSQTNTRFWAKLMLSLAPPLVAMVRSDLTPLENFDLSLVPTAQAITESLTPDVTVFVDDGRSIRIETTSSLPLPISLGGSDLFFMFYLYILFDGF